MAPPNSFLTLAGPIGVVRVRRVRAAFGMDPRLPSDFQEAGRGIAMAKLVSAASSQGHEAVHQMFEAGGPVLVEVRVPGGVFSSDWYLCQSDDDFDRLADRVEPNAVLHVSRVWDLHNRAGAVVLRR